MLIFMQALFGPSTCRTKIAPDHLDFFPCHHHTRMTVVVVMIVVTAVSCSSSSSSTSSTSSTSSLSTATTFVERRQLLVVTQQAAAPPSSIEVLCTVYTYPHETYPAAEQTTGPDSHAFCQSTIVHYIFSQATCNNSLHA
ncbi:hypothetical protein T11_8473 [Trichinella zimbabwensis]|uniref:Uncharacterized protein n=1 Tax=Trichinella zimbabwensis TaxID=268475 RepID=A0A0V1H6H1_9BILA|nr:hypothetical protein T11_8473 [Trichinella zimbabwensis]